MVIQATPQTEPAQATQGIPEAESAQKLKPEKNGLGVFAKILAGLSGRGVSGQGLKTGAEGDALGAEFPGDIPLVEQAESEELQVTAPGKGKRAGKTIKDAALVADHGKTGAIQPHKAGELSPESLEFGLSEQEMNLLFSVGRFVSQPEERISSEEGSRIAIDAETEGQNAAEAAFARLAAGTAPAEADKQTLTATQGLANSQKTHGEKTRTQNASTEATAFDRQPAGELAGDVLSRQADARKAAGSEKEGRSRLEEARSRDRRKAVTLEVRDFRGAGATVETAGKDSAGQMRVTAEGRMPSGAATREITLEVRMPNQVHETPAALNSWEAKASQAFESMLARELHQNLNNDIVRHASVMLRDGNEGTIRLALKPESLGNVKIHLEMAENRITGHIFVESEEALRAFEREIASLEKAFRDSGFEGADLEMSLAADGREQQQWQEADASRSLPWQFAASRYDAAVEQMDIPLTLDVYRQGARAINMLA